MNDASMRPDGSGPAGPDSEPPGVPGFRRWRGVYLFVLGVFLLDVALLAAFSRWFR